MNASTQTLPAQPFLVPGTPGAPAAVGSPDVARPPVAEVGTKVMLRNWLARFKREVAVVALFSCISNLLMLTPTVYMLQVYDRVLSSKSTLTLLAVSLVAVFLLMMVAFVDWSRSRVLVRLGVRMNALMAERVFRATFASARPGSQSSRPLSDLNELRQFLTGAGILVFFDIPWTPIYIGVLFLLHPVLGFVAIGFAILQGCVAMYAQRKGMAPQQVLTQSHAAAGGFLQAKVRNAEVITVMGMVNNLGRRWLGYHHVAMERAAEVQGSTHRVQAFSKWLRYSQQSIGLGVGALLVIDGQLSAGAMIAANVLMSRALAPIDQLVGSWRGYLSARGASLRLATLLSEYGQPSALAEGAKDAEAPHGEVRLDRVNVAAPRGGQPILQDVSLTLPAGKVTLLTGPSGSGKSTLARALLGVWPSDTGTVWWGDRPLTDWSAESRGPCVGYLPQDIELFAGTIADNICRLTAVDSARVVEAARKADLHEVVLRLPKGYDTPVGEAGQLLSGGQRQRLGLARAVYGRPSLVVLDEPNANLDEMGEAALLRCVDRLRSEGVAILIISHRPGIKTAADRVVNLVAGRIESIIETPRPVAPRSGTVQPFKPAGVAA